MKQNLRTTFAQVISVIPAQGVIYVRPLDAPDEPEYEMQAITLSNSPISNSGGGVYQWPNIGDVCTILIADYMGNFTSGERVVSRSVYILGYHTPQSDTGGGHVGLTKFENLQEGDKLWSNKSGIAMWMSVQGFLHLIANAWSRMWIGVNNSEIRGWFANIYLFTKTGRMSWNYLKDINRGKYHNVVSDKFEQEYDYDGDLTEPIIAASGTTYTNKEITSIGYLGDTRPFKEYEIRAGAQIGEAFPKVRIKEEYVLPSGLAYRKKVWNASDTLTIETIDSAQSDQLRVNLVNSGIGGIPYTFSFLVGRDRAVLMHTGDVVISGLGNIYIGGKGQEQQLVTKSFVTDIFMPHRHVDSCGGLSETPSNIGEIADTNGLRSLTNQFTDGTLAE